MPKVRAAKGGETIGGRSFKGGQFIPGDVLRTAGDARAGPSAAVSAARGRRGAGSAARNVRIEWYLKNVSDKIEMTMKQRILMASHHLKNKVVQNISRPVTKSTGPRGGRVVTNRSKAGEFPKAETTELMKTIFEDVRKVGGAWEGYIGTSLDYGVILELKMNRSFLVRTLREETPIVRRMLTGPLRA